MRRKTTLLGPVLFSITACVTDPPPSPPEPAAPVEPAPAAGDGDEGPGDGTDNEGAGNEQTVTAGPAELVAR